MKVKFPTISVVIATYNSQNTIEMCLESIRNQHYPQDKIDIILCDGGSTDNTLFLCKRFHPAVIKVPIDKQNAEYNKGVGVRMAKGELLLFIDHDNVLPHNKWLNKMVEPLLLDEEITAVETLRYHYDSKYSLLDRYFALFGAGDPLAFYLGKSDRLSYLYSKYNLMGKVSNKGLYYRVTFDPTHVSTLGANGFLIRRKTLIENAQIDEKHFFHIDVNVDLIKKGFNTYAFIKDDIIHFTGYKNIISFLYRRKLFMEQFHIKTYAQRRYSVFEKKDMVKLIVFIIYSLTFVKPLLDALRGYVKIRDSAWFLHPFLCFVLVCIYGYVVISTSIKKYAGRLF